MKTKTLMLICVFQIFFGWTGNFSALQAEQVSIDKIKVDQVKEFCVAAMINPSRENCDAAYLFGSLVLMGPDKENKTMKHLKCLLCTTCINCSFQHLDGLIKIADEVVKFEVDEVDRAEAHIINAYLIKSMHSISKGDIKQADIYLDIASLFTARYQSSENSDREMVHRTLHLIGAHKVLIALEKFKCDGVEQIKSLEELIKCR